MIYISSVVRVSGSESENGFLTRQNLNLLKMDLDFNPNKIGETGDHSFVKTDDFVRKTSPYPADGDDDDVVQLPHELDSLAGSHQPIKSNSHDDFEYVGSPSTTENDPEIDLLGGLSSAASKPVVDDLLGDFKSLDNFSHKAATMDFMAAERQTAASHSPTKTAAAASHIDDRDIEEVDWERNAPLKNSIYDDIENDYLKPVQHDIIKTEAANEKFISSEDLLGDFDQPEEVAPPVPKHSGVEDFYTEAVNDKTSFQPPVHVEPVVDIKPVAPVKPLPAEPIPEAKPAPVVREVLPTPKAPKDAPPQPPVRAKETKILADAIFNKIGIGKLVFFCFYLDLW